MYRTVVINTAPHSLRRALRRLAPSTILLFTIFVDMEEPIWGKAVIRHQGQRIVRGA